MRWQLLVASVLPWPSAQNNRTSFALRVCADYLSIFLAFSVFTLLGMSAKLEDPPTSPRMPIGVLLTYGALFTLLGYSERLYHAETLRAAKRERAVLLKVAIWSSVIAAIALSAAGVPFFQHASLWIGWAMTCLTMLAWRVLATHPLSSRVARNVLIVGSGTAGRELARHLKRDSTRSYSVAGFLDDFAPIGGEVRGRVKDLGRIARSEFIDEVILTTRQSDLARSVVAEARRNQIDVRIVPDCFGLDPGSLSLERFGAVPVLTLSEEPMPIASLLLKRLIDILASASLLLLAAPLLAGISVLIKLDSRGPALYRAPRLGRKGRRFLCYKFRTMVTDAEKRKQALRKKNEREGAFFKIADDPRITRVGRFLRRYSLDELPQLWNVLRGEMSLVGPRPHPVDDTERYTLEDWQRLDVTPGLTGLWQVTARQDPSFARSMQLDREYIGHWTLAMDFRILCKTVGVVLRGEGA